MVKKGKDGNRRARKRAERDQERRKRRAAARRHATPSPAKGSPVETFFTGEALATNCRRLEFLLRNDRRLRELRFDRKALVEGLEAYAGRGGSEEITETAFRGLAPQLADPAFAERARRALHATALHLGKDGDDGAPCLFGLVCLEAMERGVIPAEENPFVELLFKVQAEEEFRLARELGRLMERDGCDAEMQTAAFARRLRKLQESSGFWAVEGESRVREVIARVRKGLEKGLLPFRFPLCKLVSFPALFARALVDADGATRELEEEEVVALAASVLPRALENDLGRDRDDDDRLIRDLVRRVERAREQGDPERLSELEACLALARAIPPGENPLHGWVYVESLRDWIRGEMDLDPAAEELWEDILGDPLEAFGYLQAADHLLEEEGPEAARPVYERAVELSEEDYRALWGMARCHLAADRRATAYEWFVRALRAAEALQDRRPGIVSVEELNALEDAVDACRLPARPGRDAGGRPN